MQLYYVLNFKKIHHNFISVLNTIKKNKDFLYVLENLCLSKNNDICFLAINTLIQLCQFEQEETNMEHKLLV